MRYVGILCLCVGLLSVVGCATGTAKQPDNPTWTRHKIEKGGFMVSMPGTPTEITKHEMGLTLHMHILEYSDYTYATAYVNVPPGSRYDYDVGIKGACKAMNAHFVRQAPIKMDGASGRQYVANVEKPVGRAIGRIVFKKNRLYQVMIAGRNVTDDDINTKRFFNSFEFLPPEP